MKKLFTLIAAALMAAGAQAQVLSIDQIYEEEQAAGTVNEITMGDSKFKAVFVGGEKAKVVSKSLTFKVNADDAGENFKMQWAPGGGITKLTGARSVTITVSKKGTLTVYARSAGSDDRAFTVQQNGVAVLEAVAYNAAQFEEKYYKAWTAEIEAGTANILADAGINISALKFEAAPGQEDPVETTTVAAWNQGATEGTATWTAVGTAVLDYAGKIHSNKDGVTAMSFPNSAIASGEYANYVKIEGDFKAGDIITVQPFTNMSTADFTGSANADGVPTKYANIVLYTAEGELIADITGSTATAKTVTDGHEEAAEPKTFSYTLDKDFTTICMGRQGNSRISVIKVEIGRPSTDGINSVDAHLTNNGKWYNLQGQEVAAPAKGLFIKNGKKYVVK